MVEPFVVRTNFHPSNGRMGAAPRSIDDPLPTILGSSAGLGVAEPFILSMASGGVARSVGDPTPTSVGKGGGHLVEPFIVPNFGEREGQAPRTHSVADPLPAPTSHGSGALVEPFLTTYYGTSTVSSVDSPVPTVTTKDRFALVQPVIDGRALDIRFRMLEPRELAAAMGFPSDYAFTGNRTEIVRQIGNAVAVQTARWLCLSLLGGIPARPTLEVQEPTEVPA